MQSGTTEPATPVIEIVINEELDAASVPRFAALLHEAVDLRPDNLVIDLTECPFVDAAAVGLLLDVHRRMFSHGGRLTLRSPGPRVSRTFRLARVDNVLNVQ
ncbi:STAS domain-containing protein [Dactylosporangium sp. NPDC051541]|uniref:STAS domain-containing protein n=1 Tax=Dactylosporangium sp. NPDC051541 TaxID=3363977 RepID=UPI0037913501